MRVAKKTTLFIALLLCVGLLAWASLSPRVLAQTSDLVGPLNSGNTASPVSNPSDFGAILKEVAAWTYGTFFIVAVLFFLLAAYNFILGGSNEERVKTAKNQLKWGVIAVVVALLSVGAAYAIDTFLRTGA